MDNGGTIGGFPNSSQISLHILLKCCCLIGAIQKRARPNFLYTCLVRFWKTPEVTNDRKAVRVPRKEHD